jgi:hypothetical protein
MTPEQISKLIVADVFPGGSPWVFLILVLLISGIGSYIAKYLEAKGQNLATREDFESLRHQLTESTRVVEGIKAEFARTDWASKEWTALRIRKIEEMMSLYSTLQSHIDATFANALTRQPLPEWDNAEKAVVIAELYLPELLDNAADLARQVMGLPIACASIDVYARDRAPGRPEDFSKGRFELKVDHNAQETLKRIRTGAADLLKSAVANKATG